MATIQKYEQIIYLEQKHFANGTVILDKDYYIATNPTTYKTEKFATNLKPNSTLVYKLKENISFNPNGNRTVPLIDQGIPKPEQFVSGGGYYHDMAYGIGFFAAIAVTGTDYILDLNKCTLEQSFQHYVRQRFFSLIETANSPFLPKTGPHNFIDIIKPASYVTIRNGILGRSSHHGIHGNNNSNMLIENLKIQDFEVAAIALNGGTYNTIQNISVPRNNHNVPLLGIWSAVLFLYPYIKYLAMNHTSFMLNIPKKNYSAKKLYDVYHYEVDKVLKELKNKGYTTNPLFNNEKRIIDGPNYGILLNQKNVAVNGFPSRIAEDTNHHNKLINIDIRNIRGFNNEIPALFKMDSETLTNNYLNRNVQNDVVGSILQTQNYYITPGGKKTPLTINELGIYKGNIVSDVQLMVAKAIHHGITFGRLSTSINSIQPETIEWAEKQYQLKNTNLYYIFQGDTMHHVIKGVIALRLDCISFSELKNVNIQNISNETTKSRILYDDLIGVKESDIPSEFGEIYYNYKNEIKASHNAATYAKNQCAITRGISLSNAHNNILENVSVKYLQTEKGEIICIDYHDDIRMVEKDTIEKNVKCLL